MIDEARFQRPSHFTCICIQMVGAELRTHLGLGPRPKCNRRGRKPDEHAEH